MDAAGAEGPQQAVSEEHRPESVSQEIPEPTDKERFPQPHRKETEMREQVDEESRKNFIRRYAALGAVLGFIVGSIFVQFIDSSLLYVFGTFVGVTAGSVWGLQPDLPKELSGEFVSSSIKLVFEYGAIIVLGGFLAAIVIAVIAGALGFFVPFSITYWQSLTYGVGLVGVVISLLMPQFTYQKEVEGYFEKWDSIFRRANLLPSKIPKIAHQFDDYEKVENKINDANPHLSSTQRSAENAVKSSERYLERLREWEALSEQYEELRSEAAETVDESSTIGDISQRIEKANPEGYDRHDVEEIASARSAINSAEEYLGHFEELQRAYKSVQHWHEKCPYEIEQASEFVEDLESFDFSGSNHSLETKVDQAKKLKYHIRDWDELASRYENAVETGEIYADRFNQTKGIKRRIKQRDPARYDSHDEAALEEATQDIEALEDYIDNLETVGEFHDRASMLQKKATQRFEMIEKLLSDLESADPDFDDKTVNILREETNAVKNNLSQAKKIANLHDRISNLPARRSQVAIRDLKSTLSSLDPIPDNEIQKRLGKYETLIDCIEWALQISNRIESSISTSDLETSLNDIIRSDDILNDDISSQLDAIVTLRKRSNKILDFLDKNKKRNIPIDAEQYRQRVKKAIRICDGNRLEQYYNDVKNMEGAQWSPSDLSSYTPIEFEHLIGLLYQDKGYNVEVTQATDDRGVDVWAQRNNHFIAIQVKQYKSSNKVGRPPLQKIASQMIPRTNRRTASRVAVITSSEFTQTAVEYAGEHQNKINLIDGRDLCRQLTKSELVPPKTKLRK